MRALRRLAALGAVALLVALSAFGLWALLIRGPHVTPGRRVQVDIPKGADT
jgi:hypothetical protein